ncbi:MAG: hypothetical protein ACKOFY_07200 [Candidatus Limnocylindrus sp.]
MSLLNGKKAKELGFSDFVSSAVRGLFMPSFSLPIIVLGVAVGYATDLILKPILVDGFENVASIAAAVGPIATASGISLVTGIFIAVYGQIYGSLATGAKESTPTVGETISSVGQRGLSVLAAGLLVTLATLGIFVVGLIAVIGGAVAANAGGVTTGLTILFLVVFIYLSMRLGQAGWFAADGMGAVDAIKASWSRTQGHLLKIFFWSLGGALVFALVGGLIGLLTSSLPPSIGSSIGTGVGLVFTYASGAVLYRSITAK